MSTGVPRPSRDAFVTRRPRERTSARSYGVLFNDDRVVLVRSSNPRHAPPLWWLPGGGVDFGESPEETVVREFLEETGLLVANPTLLGVTSDVRRRDNGERIHAVRILYAVEQSGGALRDEADGTTDRARWFARGELAELNMANYARDALTQVQAK